MNTRLPKKNAWRCIEQYVEYIFRGKRSSREQIRRRSRSVGEKCGLILLILFAGISCLTSQFLKSPWVEYPLHQIVESKRIKPKFLAVNQFGDLYLLDDDNYWLIYLPGDGTEPRIAGGWGEAGENFSLPTDLVASPALDIYVCDNGTHRILRFDRKLNFLGSLDTQLLFPYSIQFPNHIVVNQLGELFVSSDQDWVIYFISSDRKMITKIGHTSYGRDRFGDIFHIALGNQNAVGIVDIGNEMFYQIERSGKILNKIELPENKCYIQPWREGWLLLGESGKLYFYDPSIDDYIIIEEPDEKTLSIFPSDFDIMGNTMFLVDRLNGKIFRSTIQFIE